jgi:hypothetical protein
MIFRDATVVSAVAALAGFTLTAFAEPPKEWGIHDLNRPQPKVVDPGSPTTPERAGRPPSDAIVLFDGKDLSGWRADKDGAPAGWKVENGYMEVVKGAGGIHTERGFGDVQLHVEWRTPAPGHGEGQERGNSGVFLMGQYEVQVLDSHGSQTYPDGQASALYGQYPPLVNASRPAGEWQTYDIVFHAPRFGADGGVVRPARVTVLHNGVLTQDNQELTGPTAHKARPPYKAHPDRLPLGLQDHGDPVRYRNIWVRELSEP